ncbi:MAG: PCRF domain-containing protein [Minisyncoccia bacterium]
MDSVLIEIRAGVGGEEAALFAKDLFRMYQKYAERKNWQISVLNSSFSNLGGFKEISFLLKGDDVSGKMCFEAGVHRVQRIPKTEKGNRIHTSTVSVAVLPQEKLAKIEIKPQDLQIEFFKSSGPGGQYINKRETGIRIKHIPTGIIVSSQESRNLHQNRENALELLKSKLFQMEKEKREKEILSTRREQIGKSERAEKIRTYNFPKNRLTDHRIEKSWYNLDEILEGKLDSVINSLIKNIKN